MEAVLRIGGPLHYLLCALLVIVALRLRRSVTGRQLALLGASWLFYLTWGWAFLGVLICSSIVNYAFGRALGRRNTRVRLWTAVAANLGILAFFKYGTSGLAGDGGIGVLHQFIHPIGISFWTLQALSYLFDLYHEDELDPSLLEFCLYLAFWPTVVSGPIARLPTLLPQLREPLAPAQQDVSEGLVRVLCGLFMKLVVAEILGAGWTPGAGVNPGFDRGGGPWGGLDVWFLAIGFGLQLYFDFAGYSNIVIGAARAIGIRLEENFAYPFRSLTPAAFWTRWHMSLSFWFRDYMFLALAAVRRGRWWTYICLVLLMLVVGLWHQAAATYIVWGGYHGALLVAHRLGQQVRRSIPYQWPPALGRALSWASTFALISIGWLFFRAASLSQALAMAGAILRPGSYGALALPRAYYAMIAALVVVCLLYYAAQMLVARWRTTNEADAASLAASAGPAPVTVRFRPQTAAITILDLAGARLWWWLAPLVIVVGLFGGLAVYDLRPPAPRSPFMYTLF